MISKIRVDHILKGHLNSLSADDTYSYDDLCLFYLIPLLLAVCFFAAKVDFVDEVYSASLSAFSIFVALLLTVQVALFTIFERQWPKPDDIKEEQEQLKKIALRRHLLSELNTNIAYLTVICIFYVVASLTFMVFDMNRYFEASASCFFLIHFVLTMLMVIKRTYALFEHEYSGANAR